MLKLNGICEGLSYAIEAANTLLNYAYVLSESKKWRMDFVENGQVRTC